MRLHGRSFAQSREMTVRSGEKCSPFRDIEHTPRSIRSSADLGVRCSAPRLAEDLMEDEKCIPVCGFAPTFGMAIVP